MKRFITESLCSWKTRHRRKPLLLRGARQVGKTWTVLDFGRSRFPGSTHLVDLEKRPDWHRLFERDLDAKRIVAELQLLLGTRIVPGRDLLFFDEIQACPRAITALRYFHEDLPDLHVVATGSLLEFALGDLSMPVGRIQCLEMHPMSFPEFLLATGRDLAVEVVLSGPGRHEESVHRMLLEELRRYLFVGGMPESVAAFASTGTVHEALEVQRELIETFRQDFSKYAPRADKRCVNGVLSSVARSVGRQIKYSKMSDSFSQPTVKRAFELLCTARLVHRVAATSPAGLPLGASTSEHRFKAVLVDLGLMQNLCGVRPGFDHLTCDLLDLHEGALAEQFVGQELLAAGQEDLYYWAREAKSSSAEVDYLIVRDGAICPLEIKSGASGRLRSMHLCLATYPQCSWGIVLSTAPAGEIPDQRLKFVPLYHAFSIGARPAR